MTRFTAIDLSRLPPQPKTALSADAYAAAYSTDITARLNAAGIPYNVGALETDTYAITGEAFAYRTALVATSIDDAIAAVLLPTAYGAYLDLLGATQDPPVQRQPVVPNPRPWAQYPQDWQTDDVFRGLIQLAPEALSTCGPAGAYIWFASEVADVGAVAAYGPMSFGGTRSTPFTPLGQVNIPIVSTVGDGTAGADLVAAVAAAVNGRDVRPIADFVVVSAATIVPYTVDATLQIGSGADPGQVLTAAAARLRVLADLSRYPGGAVRDQDIYVEAKLADTSGVPVVGPVTLNGWSNVNAVPITPAAPGCAYVAPYCAPGTATSSTDQNGLPVLTAGGITVRAQVVDA